MRCVGVSVNGLVRRTQITLIENQFSNAIRELQLGKLLRKANITKNCGISAYEVFQFLLLLVFQGKNLFRFLNETSYNRNRFLLLLAAKVTAIFDKHGELFFHVL